MLDQFRDLIFLGIKRGPHLGNLALQCIAPSRYLALALFGEFEPIVLGLAVAGFLGHSSGAGQDTFRTEIWLCHVNAIIGQFVFSDLL